MPWFFCLYLLGLIWLAPPAQAQNLPPRPQPIQYVNDYAKILSPSTRQALEQSLENYFQQGQNEIVLVTIESLGDYTETEIAQGIFDTWQIGLKGQDQGILVLVAMKQRRFRIHTGYGAEAFLPDVKAKALLNEHLLPAFRAQNYDQGLTALITALQAIKMERIEPDKMPSLLANPLDLTLNLIFWLGFFLVLFTYAGPEKRRVFHRRRVLATSIIAVLILFSAPLWGQTMMLVLLLGFICAQTLLEGFTFYLSAFARARTLIFGLLFLYLLWYLQPDFQEVEGFFAYFPYLLYAFALSYVLELRVNAAYLQRFKQAGFEHYPAHLPAVLQFGLPALLILGAYNAQNWPKYADFVDFVFIKMGLGFNFLEPQLGLWAFFLGSLPLIWLSQKTLSAWHEHYPFFSNIAAIKRKDPMPNLTLFQNYFSLGALPELGLEEPRHRPLHMDFQALEKNYLKEDLEAKRLEFLAQLKKLPPHDMEAQEALHRSLRTFFRNPQENLVALALPKLQDLYEKRWPKLNQGPHFNQLKRKIEADLTQIKDFRQDQPWAKTCLDFWEKLLATTGSDGKPAYLLWLDMTQEPFWKELAKNYQISTQESQTWEQAAYQLLQNWNGQDLETLNLVHQTYLPLALNPELYFKPKDAYQLKLYWEDGQLAGLWSDPLYLQTARHKLQTELTQVQTELSQALDPQTGSLLSTELEEVLNKYVQIIKDLKQDPSKHLPYDEAWLNERLTYFSSDTYFNKYQADYEINSIKQAQKTLKLKVETARTAKDKLEVLTWIYQLSYQSFLKEKPKYVASSSSSSSSSGRSSWSSSSSSSGRSSSSSSSGRSSSSSSSGRSSFGGGSSGGGGASGGW